MIELREETRETLTKYEEIFISENSYRLREEAKESYSRSPKCYIRNLDCYLENYMDIVKLFSDRENFSDFMDFLFKTALRLKKDGGSPYLYHRPDIDGGKRGKIVTYVFDYNFIIMVITEWGINILNADDSDFRRYMAQFSSGNKDQFLKYNYFLIVSIFSHMYMLNTLPYTSFKTNPRRKYRLEINYFTPYVVKTIKQNKYYFLGVPFAGSESLKYLSDETIEELFEKRLSNDLTQELFGNSAKTIAEDSEGKLQAFWKIAHPLIEKT